MEWTWVNKKVVMALHDEQLSEHSGQGGIRDEGLLDAALMRPINKANYGTSSAAARLRRTPMVLREIIRF